MDFTLGPQVIAYIAGFPISNAFVVTVILSIILMLIFTLSSLRMREVPRGLQLFLEILVDGSREFMNETTHSDKVTRRLHPWLLTIFLLFLFGNLLSFIPGVSAITFNGEHIYRAATTDYNLVFILALVFLIISQAVGIISGGLWAYLGRFINFKSPLKFILGLFEIIAEVAKLISVSFRFFGNAFAAEVMLAVLFSIVPYVVPLPFIILLLLASVVQPAVFALLIMIYIQMSLSHADPTHT